MHVSLSWVGADSGVRQKCGPGRRRPEGAEVGRRRGREGGAPSGGERDGAREAGARAVAIGVAGLLAFSNFAAHGIIQY